MFLPPARQLTNVSCLTIAAATSEFDDATIDPQLHPHQLVHDKGLEESHTVLAWIL